MKDEMGGLPCCLPLFIALEPPKTIQYSDSLRGPAEEWLVSRQTTEEVHGVAI